MKTNNLIELTEKEKQIQKILENSFLKEYMDEKLDLTDISFNGTHLWLKDNQKGSYMSDKHPTKDEVYNIGKAIADENGKEFTENDAILDTELPKYRVNFVHTAISTVGSTFSLRLSKPELATNSLSNFANKDVEKLLSLFVGAGINILISGITGAGKTELQKHLVKYIEDKIILIEDTMDSHIKALYPEKNIFSWRTLTDWLRERQYGSHQLIQAALRNDPVWILIAETRGADAYNVVEAALTGHKIMTTLHSESAGLILSRVLSLIGETRQINEMRMGNDLVNTFPIGLQVDYEETEEGVLRFIQEIVEFKDYHEKGAEYTSLYRIERRYNKKTQEYEEVFVTNPISEKLRSKLEYKRLIHLIPEIFLKEGEQVHEK